MPSASCVLLLGALLALGGCERDGAGPRAVESAAPRGGAALATPSASSTSSARAASAPPGAPGERLKVELQEVAMGTDVHLVAYSNAKVGAEGTEAALAAAFAEMQRLARLMSDWTADSDVARVNHGAGSFVTVDPETFSVIEKSLWVGKLSGGVFDITFQAMSGVWKFGDAQEAHPRLPDRREILEKQRLIDYRKLEVRPETHQVMVPKGMSIGLGGIAKGYIVDRAARVLRDRGLADFLVQAGGDLYGAGRKPDGSPWVSGIQDPRGPRGTFFATIELTDHAFSTAGDYARAYVLGGKRYHHVIDPRTGYPATASRSVTLWAPDAFVADAIDDAVFILGPEKGLALVDSLGDCGAVIVDAKNKVWVSERIKERVHLLREPTDGI
ncbi:MAG: FAD:protein FMN transferase [Sorangiineae bacterium]|nr:FAD:protein FMN transferase [Polyangiaceae bacterium]MEB2324936.1 FAD:protein FMN transferase [Sorangiineae bacterium]